MSKISKPTLVSCVATALSIAIVSMAAFADAKSTKDGAFTVDQTARGKVIYDKSCGNCHQADIRDRLSRFESKSVGQLLEVVSTAMPADNPGSLALSEYVDALAYIFSITGSPVGSEELTPDSADSVNVGPLK